MINKKAFFTSLNYKQINRMATSSLLLERMGKQWGGILIFSGETNSLTYELLSGYERMHEIE